MPCGPSRTVAGPVAAQSRETVQSFREKDTAMLNQYDVVFQRLGSAKGQKRVNDARLRLQESSDTELAAVFQKAGVPDLSEAVAAVGRLASLSPAQPALAGLAIAPLSADFPGAPGIIDVCDNIVHTPEFTYGALVAYQIVRTILAVAQFACLQVIVGENAAAGCIALAIAADVAAIPLDQAEFCGGEEDSALLQGSYDRLDHIHTDLENAQAAIIANDNANTTTIINNDNANRDLIVNELHALGCELVRLLNTPEGQKESSILACTGQPGFPYAFPAPKKN